MSDDVQKIQLDVEESDNNRSTSGVDEESFLATQRLIQTLSVKIDELKRTQKELRQRLKNIMENDVALNELEEQAKNAAEGFKKRKKELMDSVEAKDVKMKIKEATTEINEMEESLTGHLLTYYQVTGVQSFETPSGGEREFKINAKLMPRKEE